MWKSTKHRATNSVQDIRVAILVDEMAKGTYATYAGEFDEGFKIRLKEIPRTNAMVAEYLYKCTAIDTYKLEIWKLTAFGELKHKMFTLEFIK